MSKPLRTLAVVAAVIVVLLCAARRRWPETRITGAVSDGSAPRSTPEGGVRVSTLSAWPGASEPGAPSLVGRVQNELGGAIAGARVCIAEPQADCSAPITCTETSAAGRFMLLSRPASSPTLFVSRAGYVPLTQRPIDTKQRLSLVLTLKQGGAQISGTVMDAAGGPLVGAELRASDSHQHPVGLGVSDGSGRFVLDVASGVTQILARATGYAEAQREVEAPLAGLELRLTAASSIAGRVLAEETGAPIGDVLVSAESAEQPRELEVRTLEDGTFRFSGLGPGRYSVAASSERWRSETQSVILELAESAEAVELRLHPASQLLGVVQLAGRPCPDGLVTLLGPVQRSAQAGPDGGVTIDGLAAGRYRADVRCQAARIEETLAVAEERVSRVWNLKAGLRIAGVALNGKGTPVVGGLVSVRQLGSPADRANATTDQQGEFSCAGLEPGNYEVQLVSQPPRTDPVRVQLTADSSARVVLRTHAEAAIRVRLEGAQRFDSGTLSVIAKGTSEQPFVGELKGDTFVFDPLPLGTYDVRGDFGSATSARRVELTTEGQIAELTLELPDAHSIRGLVIDVDGGAVPDAWIRASAEFGSGAPAATQAVLSNSDGSFMINGLAPGRYTLNVHAGQGEGQLAAVQSDSPQVTVRLRTFGALSGTVRDAAGGAVPDFVLLYRHEDAKGASMVTGSHGAWSVPWLAPGHYELTAQSAEGTALGHVLLPPGGKLSVALQLEPAQAASPNVPSGATAAAETPN